MDTTNRATLTQWLRKSEGAVDVIVGTLVAGGAGRGPHLTRPIEDNDI